MNSLTPEILFLHGGPGMTAELERREFGPSLPVHWWDQPLVRAGANRAFEALIDAAEVEIARLSTEREGRIDLLANSFGAYLARALVDRAPERIGAITICSGVWDLCTAILRLGWRFARSHGDEDLEAPVVMRRGWTRRRATSHCLRVYPLCRVSLTAVGARLPLRPGRP